MASMSSAFSWGWGRWVAQLGLLAGVVVASPSAHADAPADPDASRITAAGHTLKWSWVPPGRSDRYGHAETIVHAPIGAVRAIVQDFSHYKDLTPDGMRTSRVVGHQPDGSTDVYLQLGVLNDMLTFWNVTRFAPIKPDGASEILEGHMIPGRGNIDDSAAVWTLRSLGPDFTVLKLDALLRPGLPAPQSTIDNELRNSAERAVNSVHDKAQGSSAFVPVQ